MGASPACETRRVPNSHTECKSGQSYYSSQDAYLEAIADAMRPEYEAIVAGGFEVQIVIAKKERRYPGEAADDLPWEHIDIRKALWTWLVPSADLRFATSIRTEALSETGLLPPS
jgi:hypothetical protein